MSDIYYIVKSAVYDHGVMWVGDDIDKGMEKADFYASNYDDGHHEYQLRKHAEPSPSDSGWDKKTADRYDHCDWSDNSEVIYIGVDKD